jgi:hypothetical protein
VVALIYTTTLHYTCSYISIRLKDSSNAAAIVAALTKNMTTLGIDKIISGTDLKTLGFTNSSPANDTRVPDIILVTTPG